METEISDRVRSIADQVKSSVTYSNEPISNDVETKEFGGEDLTSVVFKVDEEKSKIYENNLPDGITLETVEKLKNYDLDFEAGVLLGIGESTLELMKKDNDLMHASVKVNAAPDREVSVYIGTHEDMDEARMNSSIFGFYSNVRIKSYKERQSSSIPTVREHLDDIYTKALCDAVK